MAKLPGYRSLPTPVAAGDDTMTATFHADPREPAHPRSWHSAPSDDIVWRMSHELRLPLNSIIGFAQLLLDHETEAPLDGQQHEFVERIIRAGHHLTDIVNDMIEVAALRAGRLALTRVPVSPGLLLEDARAQLAPLALAKAQQITVQVAPSLPPISVDPRRMGQVVLNLLGNAITYAPRGGTITLGAQRGPAGAVDLFVHNRGPIIPRAQHRRIFEPFAQLPPAHASAEDEPHGAGLGLAISRQLVLLHGGRIWVRSSQRHGTTFWVRLPG